MNSIRPVFSPESRPTSYEDALREKLIRLSCMEEMYLAWNEEASLSTHSRKSTEELLRICELLPSDEKGSHT